MTNNDYLLDAAGACRLIGGPQTPIHRATLHRGVQSGIYPKPIKVSANTNRWRYSELMVAIERLASARDSGEARQPESQRMAVTTSNGGTKSKRIAAV